MNSHIRDWFVLVALCLLTLVVALSTRPLLPVDETRYVSVAWEMWRSGEFVLPLLNGEPYSHKPPLLFWIMHAGWFAMGVNDWWPRVIAALFSLASLFLVQVIAWQLWPSDDRAVSYAPWVLFGILPWTLFFTLVQFDMLLVTFVLLGILGVLRVVRGHCTGWIFFALGIGLGGLSKGPVVLVHLLPIALLAPLWATQRPVGGWSGWYAGFIVSVVSGVVVVLLWAIPAAQSGGEAYAHAIFWSQSAQRITDSFAHREPAWWYLVWAPLLLVPWLFWRPVWRGLATHALWRDRGVRLLLAWVLPVLLILSLVSGKQLKYLMPVVPALALLVARALTEYPDTRGRPWPAGIALLFGGIVLAGLSFVESATLPYWSDLLAPGWGFLLAGSALLLVFARNMSGRTIVVVTTLGSALLVSIFHFAVVIPAAPAYDVTVVARKLGELQAGGAPVANVGKYHGQFHFPGRLSEPLTRVDVGQERQWARAHPSGYLVFYAGHQDIPVEGSVYHQPWRSRNPGLVVWKSEDFLMLE